MEDPEAMFELRLGLALGKSLAEIRALPYPEFRKWLMFYAVEPWGFANQEYQFAALRAEIHNTKITKKSQARSPKHFIRDMFKEVVKFLRKERTRVEREESVDLNTPEGRALATERVIQAFSAMFGNRVVRKDK